MTDTIDFRTARVLVRSRMGALFRLVLDGGAQQTLTALLIRISDGTVEAGDHAYTHPTKAIVIKPGVPVDIGGRLAGRFVAYATEHADDRSFVGWRNGIAYQDGGSFYYVYQTATQIVVQQG